MSPHEPGLLRMGTLLDRLLSARPPGRPMPLDELLAALRHDLQHLLNARRPWATIPDRLAPLRGTIVGYGLPDFISGAFNAPEKRALLLDEMAATIRRFEPRLSAVDVRFIDRADIMDPVLRIRIEAWLRLEDGDEAVAFDTMLDATTSDLTLQRGVRG